MYKSASSELSAPAQARDHRLKANLRAALLADQGLAGLTLSPDVIMERGFVIGRVDTSDQAEAVRRITNNIADCDRWMSICRSLSQRPTPNRTRSRI